MNNRFSSYISGSGIFLNFFLGLGLALCGLFLGKSIEKSVYDVKHNTFVSVKGLVERRIKSDRGSLNIDCEINGNNIEAILQQAKDCKTEFYRFCAQHQIQTSEISEEALRLNDRHKDFYPTQYNPTPPSDRYEISWNFSIRSQDVDKIKEFYKKIDEFSSSLMKTGNINIHTDHPQYAFTKLEDIRADMIAEATRSARKAADQFAQDSKCQVGKIKHANQGNIRFDKVGDGILKIARLVSHVDFYLK